jgi:hypothetical protein
MPLFVIIRIFGGVGGQLTGNSRHIKWDACRMGKDRRLALSILVAGVAVVVVGVSAGFKSGHVPWSAWATAAACGLLAMGVAVGRKPLDIVSGWLAEPMERLVSRSEARGEAFSLARRVDESRSRVALNVHPAIPLPANADSDLSTDFPEYVTRAVDADLRAWIKSHRRSGGLVVLVGDAAAGKTRSLYEALQAEVPDWRMPSIDKGSRINTIVRKRVNLSKTVLWLDELQNFFVNEPLTVESVRQLTLGRLGAVLIAGTIRAEELDRLLTRTGWLLHIWQIMPACPMIPVGSMQRSAGQRALWKGTSKHFGGS